jgi:hypothetical protein
MEDKMKAMTIVRYLVFSSIVFLFAVHVPLLFAQDIQTRSAASKTEDESKTKEIETGPLVPSAGSPGMKVYRDPVTGKFLVPPPEKLLPAETPKAEEATSSSSEGLEERTVDKPGGGVMIDLKGRFQQRQTATKGPDGTISIHCTPDAPAPTEDKNTNTR